MTTFDFVHAKIERDVEAGPARKVREVAHTIAVFVFVGFAQLVKGPQTIVQMLVVIASLGEPPTLGRGVGHPMIVLFFGQRFDCNSARKPHPAMSRLRT